MTTHSSAADIRSALAEVVHERRSMPPIRATYRLQFNHAFTFADATRLVPYFADLGISHVYASPIFTAAPGSMHGYNVVDFTQINPEIGPREEFDRFVSELHRHGLGLILDFVPNHMGIEAGANVWWQDVLENGVMSRFADYFDIDWTPLKRALQHKVLLPFLGEHYGDVLERGELVLAYQDGGFHVQYWDTPFPINPRTWPVILRRVEERLRPVMAPDDLDFLELQSIIVALENLPDQATDQPERDLIEQRAREQVVTRHRLNELSARTPIILEVITNVVSEFNGRVGNHASFDDLDALLHQQSYRLSYWRVAAEEINYRRFFAINTLAAIRQEDPTVFAETHRLLIDLLVDGAVDGVRFDHPDGLWDPAGYFLDVQRGFLRGALRRRLKPETDEQWHALLPEVDAAIDDALGQIREGDRVWPVWVVGEKILEHDESLPTSWPIAGTVGYEFARATTGLFVDPAARSEFDKLFARYTDQRIRFHDLVYDMKVVQMREAFVSEMNVLTNLLGRIAEQDRHSRDFTTLALRSALREIMANFAVYRTYSTCDQDAVTEHDCATIEAAVRLAKKRNPQMAPTIFDFVRDVLLLHPARRDAQRSDLRCHFAMKVQQLTGPVMAKGLEDTTFYRFNRLVSLNEVGGNPAEFGAPVSAFHKENAARLATWPLAMINSSTHDTKRSEDVRARISVISEKPAEFRAALNRWTRLNRKFKKRVDGAGAPNRADAWVIYQTLIGTWPLAGRAAVTPNYVSRLQEYMIKVAREAGRFTNWVNPDSGYEDALRSYIANILDAGRSAPFLEDIDAWVQARIPAGLMNALAQQVLKLTVPGVPDIYQGTEMWDDSLVDPDNRRAVDYDIRQDTLARLADRSLPDLAPDLRAGDLKLFVTSRLLRFRRDHRELFRAGAYTAMQAEGHAANHVVAFRRSLDDGTALVVLTPRLLTQLAPDGDLANPTIWGETTMTLPDGEWHSLLDETVVAGGVVPLASLFDSLSLTVLACLPKGRS